MCRRILCSKVSFIFDNPASEQLPPFAADQQFAQQLASYDHRIAIEELQWKNLTLPQHRRRNTAAMQGCVCGIGRLGWHAAIWHRF
jgi:hypothetical protein